MYGYEPNRIRNQIESIYNLDRQRTVRLSYESLAIQQLYRDYLDRPGSERAHRLLHTRYQQKAKRV
jgi:NADH-quinone oxidoreductase subunit G/NADP-reducing hydrogenase subunit HndD